jgi:hypothetical protein
MPYLGDMAFLLYGRNSYQKKRPSPKGDGLQLTDIFMAY